MFDVTSFETIVNQEKMRKGTVVWRVNIMAFHHLNGTWIKI